MCHSDGLHDKQSRGFDQTLAKAHRQLAEVSARLARGKDPQGQGEGGGRDRRHPRPALGGPGRSRPPSPATTRQSCASASAPTKRPGLGLGGGAVRQADPVHRQDASSRPRRARSSPSTDPRRAVEGDFRQMKDPKVVSFSPMFHFTESKIRVHVSLLRARPHGRPPHGPRGRPGRLAPERPSAALAASPASKRPSFSTKASGDVLVPGACSPRKTPPSSASTTSSASTPTPRSAEPDRELGTTHRHNENRRPPGQTPHHHGIARKVPLAGTGDSPAA